MLQFLGLVFLVAVAYPASGWVLSVLWRWFIAPTFGLPELTIAQAIGVSMVIGFLAKPTTTTKKEEQRGLGEIVALWIGSLVLTLFIGWIVHLFM